MNGFSKKCIVAFTCLYLIFGCIYILCKDYSGEKAEQAKFIAVLEAQCAKDKFKAVYIPSYDVRLKVPIDEYPKEDEFILNKDYPLCGSTRGFYIILMIAFLCMFIGILIDNQQLKK